MRWRVSHTLCTLLTLLVFMLCYLCPLCHYIQSQIEKGKSVSQDSQEWRQVPAQVQLLQVTINWWGKPKCDCELHKQQIPSLHFRYSMGRPRGKSRNKRLPPSKNTRAQKETEGSDSTHVARCKDMPNGGKKHKGISWVSTLWEKSPMTSLTVSRVRNAPHLGFLVSKW